MKKVIKCCRSYFQGRLKLFLRRKLLCRQDPVLDIQTNRQAYHVPGDFTSTAFMLMSFTAEIVTVLCQMV
jgi:hypothetical protein